MSIFSTVSVPSFFIMIYLYSQVELDLSDPLSSHNVQFLRGLLTLGQLQQRNTLTEKAMSAEQVYHM